MSDEANRYWEKEAREFRGKHGGKSALIGDPVYPDKVHVARLTPLEAPAGQHCEAIVNGHHCGHAPMLLTWYTDPCTNNVVAMMVCVDHYARRMAQLMGKGVRELKHDRLPSWYADILEINRIRTN